MEKREIKFRAWNEINKEMIYPRKGAFNCLSSGDILNKYDKVMQFTGCVDMNEKDIYEGDLLYCDSEPGSTHLITYDETAARFVDERLDDGDSCTSYDGFDFVVDTRIIGNIYENPEILERF